MLDLLASKGTKEILQYIREKSKPPSSTQINKHFTKGGTIISLTTATIYRRLKELELAGLIIRQPPGSKTFILTQQANDILDRYPEMTHLRKPHREVLQQIKQYKDANVVELQEKALLSPTTINVGLQKLSELGLIEQIKIDPKKPIKSLKRGRPKKRHRLTKKGEEVYEAQTMLEEEQTK